jgi:hypothetical protein
MFCAAVSKKETSKREQEIMRKRKEKKSKGGIGSKD